MVTITGHIFFWITIIIMSTQLEKKKYDYDYNVLE